MRLTIDSAAAISAARGREDLDEVFIVTDRLKYRGLLPCALKYALWAVRPGGLIVIEDDYDREAAERPYRISSNFVRQWVFKFIGAQCELLAMNRGTLTLRRTAPVLAPGWSAGVVFSGSDGEIPTLHACLDGLRAQAELGAAQGGEIVVCGPARDLGFLAGYPDVRYENFEMPAGPRMLISRKKNVLMSRLRGPRFVILHARVVLDPGALARVPREFDISGPVTRHDTRNGERHYLSLSHTDSFWPGAMPRTPALMLRDVAPADPMALMGRGAVYVDGGAFYVTRPVFEACPLHDQIAWEEAEDVEWCARAFASGFLVDIVPGSGARSQTSKLADRSGWGRAEQPIRRLSSGLKTVRAAGRHHFQRLGGRR